MVSTSTTSISIAVPSNSSAIHDVLAELDEIADVTYRACSLLRTMSDADVTANSPRCGALGDRDVVVRLQEGMSIVSLIGLRMKATIGVAGAMFTALAKNRMLISLSSPSFSGFCHELRCP
jgi:aspartokinase